MCHEVVKNQAVIDAYVLNIVGVLKIRISVVCVYVCVYFTPPYFVPLPAPPAYFRIQQLDHMEKHAKHKTKKEKFSALHVR